MELKRVKVGDAVIVRDPLYGWQPGTIEIYNNEFVESATYDGHAFFVMKTFDPTNHGEWGIAHIYAGSADFWQVYRLRDKDFTDYSGNREYAGPVFDSEPEARVWLEANKGALPGRRSPIQPARPAPAKYVRRLTHGALIAVRLAKALVMQASFAGFRRRERRRKLWQRNS